jgi:hypothetical protein
LERSKNFVVGGAAGKKMCEKEAKNKKSEKKVKNKKLVLNLFQDHNPMKKSRIIKK